MKAELIGLVDYAVSEGINKWGYVDRTPGALLNAVTEEVGEVAHAINHNEGKEVIITEISHAMGVLTRLYNMVC